MVRQAFKRILGQRGSALIRRMRAGAYEIRHVPAIRVRWLLLRLAVSLQRRRADAPVAESPRRGSKKHVLFVTEKWCDGNPEYGLSNNTHNLFGSLEASGLATESRFYYDEYRHQQGRGCDAALIQQCMEYPPDLLFLTWMPFSVYNPKLETLRIIRRMGVPIVAWWGDTVNPAVMEMADRVASIITVTFVSDSTSAYLRSAQQDKYQHTVPPQDPRVFYDAGLSRDIGISFLGSIHRNYSDRRAALDALRANGITVHQAGGQRENPLSVDEYARTYMRSRIGLSFARAGQRGEWVQLKGHVFEITLCGAMLLDSDNHETRKWFEPMVDYVPFTNEADLIEKTRYYLEHDAERLEIARSGHQKARARYTGEKFWEAVFTTVFGNS